MNEATIRGELGETAVSYTHLDVYKRQVLGGVLGAFFLMLIFALMTMLSLGQSAKLIVQSLITVSYTHLDVYKRQA